MRGVRHLGIFCGLGKKCAKSSNLNIHQQIKMSYIQSFLTNYLPQYYSYQLCSHKNNEAFFDFHSNPNIFSLTCDLLLFAGKPSASNWHHLHKLIVKEMLIPYEYLQNYQQKPLEGDSTIVRIIKTDLKQVHMQMQQLLLRLIICYLEAIHAQQINNTILQNINEIGYIYPLLKTQISFKYNHINLSSFIQKYITQITSQQINHSFIEIILRIKEECAFMGTLERIIDRMVEKYQTEEAQSKKVDTSSNDSELDLLTQKDNTHSFQDEQLRKKKKKVFKESVKAKSQIDSRTPTKEKMIFIRHTPKTQKNQQHKKSNEAKSPLKKTPIFKKIKKASKKPMQRTIYYGQTKRFVPKKSSSNAQQFIQSLITTSTLINQTMAPLYFFESNSRKTEKKLNKLEIIENQSNIFCIPETPRPQVDKRNSMLKKAYSMDLTKGCSGLFKN